jgi:thiazole synthase
LVLYGETFASRLLLGTSRYPSPQVLADAVRLAQPAMLTASLRRQTAHAKASPEFFNLLKELKVPVLPNTAGCHSVQEVLTTAEMAREVFETDWLKLELMGDDYTLQPDTLKLPETAERLIKAGFKGKDDAQIVDQWFQSICRNILNENFEQWEANQPVDTRPRRVDRNDLGTGRTEIS